MTLTLPTYAEWRPTGLDCRGLGLSDRQDWLVAPVIQTRDSGSLARSNFEVVREDLESGDDGDTEVHRFGHWGPGWFEIILVRPGSPAAAKASHWAHKLEGYPVADEHRWSALQCEEAVTTWRRMSYRHRREAGATREEARRQALPADNTRVWEYLTRDE